MISVKKRLESSCISICADLIHHGFIKDWRKKLHLFISNSLKSICDDSGAIAYRFDNFHKNIDLTIDRPWTEFQNICNTPSKVTGISKYSFGINIKSYFEEMTIYGIISNGGNLIFSKRFTTNFYSCSQVLFYKIPYFALKSQRILQ